MNLLLGNYPVLIRLQRIWLFFLLILIPFSLTYITLHPAAISYLNLLSVGFIVLAIVNAVMKTIPLVSVKDRGTWGVIGLLVVAMLFALLFTHPLRNGIGLWTSRLLQPLLVGAAVHQMLEAGVLQISEIVETLFLSLVPLILYGILQGFGIVAHGIDPHRITDLYQFPNTFARYVEIVLLVSLPWIVLRKASISHWEMLVWAAGFLLLLSTVSYNGTVTTVIGIAAMTLLLGKQFKKLKIWTLVTIAVVALGVGLGAQHLPKWHTSITDSRLTRIEFWTVAEGTIKEHFWTGIGIKGWETQYSTLVLKYGPHTPPLNWASEQPQNVFLDSMLLAGPLGLISITLLLLWPVVRGFQVTRLFKLEENGWFGIAMVGYGIAIFCFGLIDDPLWSDDVTPLLYIFLMCLAWLYIRGKKVTQVTEQV